MRTTRRPLPRFNFLHPAWSLAFVAIIVLWVIVAGGDDWQSPAWRGAARLAGYVAFLAMLVPYLHIIRRAFRTRLGIAQTIWLRWHIGAAYVAFLMVLIHSRGRANGPVTTALVWLVWIVMLSGVIGYYGQKLIYRILPRMLPAGYGEYGLERLETERERLQAEGQALLESKEIAGAQGIVAEFSQAVMKSGLEPPLRFSVTAWMRPDPADTSILSDNGHERAAGFADAAGREKVNELWSLLKRRRGMDLEYRMHQLGRLWLLVHGPAAWALFVLMIEHVVMSWWYGGF